MTDQLNVSIIGASGYAGGELLRLLAGHPNVTIRQITSERFAGKPAARTHPNLRGVPGGGDLNFCSINDIEPCDLLFTGLPHGKAQDRMPDLMQLAPRIIDLSADFRLNDPAAYKRWYKEDHRQPELLQQFQYGVAEVNRDNITGATHVAGAGCNATATILALKPLFAEGLTIADRTVVEAKVGSSEAGNSANEASHHPIRTGCVRSFMPTGHRHTAEIEQELAFGRDVQVHFSATAVEMVRGVLVTAHVFLDEPLAEKDIWKIYRKHYASEPFVRFLNARQGVYRLPEPKLVAGTNFCDIGFQMDSRANRLVVIAAIDNLMKGAAGQAVQAMNLMCGYEETTALEFTGFHP